MESDVPKTEPPYPGVAPESAPPAVSDDKPSLAEAKRRFAEAMHELDLLEPLRKHPYVVVGAAATAGAVLGGSGKVVMGLGGLAGAVAKMIKPLGGLVAQLAAAKLAAHTAVNETQSQAVAPDNSQEPIGANI